MAQDDWWANDKDAPQGRTIVVGPADPTRRANARKTAVSADIDEATKAAQIRKANAEADAAEIKVKTDKREAAMQTTLDPAVAASIKGLGLDELLLSIQAARREIGTGKATGITGSLMRMFPGTTANDLSGSINAIQGATIMEKLQALKDASKTGASGMGALSEREGQRLADSIAALNTNLSDEKLMESLATIERHANSLRAVAAGKNPDDPAVAKEYGIAVEAPGARKTAPPAAAPGNGSGPGTGGGGPANPDGGSPPPSDLTLSRDGTQAALDPALAGADAHVRAMIRKQRPITEINAYLESLRPGLSKQVSNIPEWLRFVAMHPNHPAAKNPDVGIERTNVPLTSKLDLFGIPVGKAWNSAAQSAPGALAMGAADILTGGTLDNMTSNPALTRAGMAGVAQAHPVANFAGQVGGGVLAGLGAEMGAARAGAGGLASLLAGDAIPAAAYGAGSSDEGSRLGGGAMGMITGIGGGAVGRGLGRVVSGAADAGVRRLAQAGVRLTPGQMLGGIPKRLEDAATSVPILGDMIRNQRTRGVEDFNRAAFGEALQPIGAVAGEQIGEAGIGNAEEAIGQAYRRALGGARVVADPEFEAAARQTMQAARAIPRVGEEVSNTLEQAVPAYFEQGAQVGSKQVARFPNVVGALPSKGVAPAFLGVDGKVYAGSALGNHFTAITPELKAAGIAGTGFVDAEGSFLSREDALRHVTAQGERIKPSENMAGELDALDYREQSPLAHLPPQPEFRDVPVYGPSTLSGENVQPMLQELRGFRSGYRTDPLGNRVGARVRDMEGAVTDMFARQAPEVMPAFNSANDAWGRFEILRDAVMAGKNQNGRFMPSQLNQAAVANTKRFAGRGAAARGDRAFFELGRDGQNVLPSTIPDSGTATRGFLPGALAVGLGGVGGGAGGYASGGDAGSAAEGAGMGVGGTLALGTALASPYLSRAILQRVLTANRAPMVDRAGRIIAASRLPGALALPLLSEGP